MNKMKERAVETNDEMEAWADVEGLVYPELEYLDLCGMWTQNPHYENRRWNNEARDRG
jgi:hypothetical protein